MFLYASVFEEVQNEGKPLVKATMSRLVPMWLARSCFCSIDRNLANECKDEKWGTQSLKMTYFCVAVCVHKL